MKHRYRQSKPGSRIIAIFALVGVIAVIAGGYYLGRLIERNGEKPEVRGDYRARRQYDTVLEFEGHRYAMRNNISTMLLIGVDKDTDDAEVVTSYRNGGQADFLRLMVLDHGNRTLTQLAIDRDTMTPITILGFLGNRSGVRTAQISLSHGFGDGKEQSCELTVDAVSNLLLGTPIDYYIAMNMDGIGVLNDMAGGVTVTLEDDFTALDSAMIRGRTMTLRGVQAQYYTRNRREIGIGTNESRMARQEKYISSLFDAMNKAQCDDGNFVGTVWDELTPYLVSNMSRGMLVNDAWNAGQYEHKPVLKIKGEHRIASDGFMEFYADEDDLRRVVLDLLYEQVDE